MLLHLAAILAALAAPAHAADSGCHAGTLCSRTFYAAGPCDGTDHLAELKNPADEAPAALVRPWESAPISIVGYRLAVTSPGHGLQYVLPGNSFTPDIMGGLGADRLTGGEMFGAAGGFAFPAAGGNVEAHLDLHYACTGLRFQGYYVVYYKMRLD